MSFDIQLRRGAGIALLAIALVSCGGSDKTAVTPVTAMPTISVASGPFTSAQSVTITDATSGAIIYYTTDGTTPTITSSTYSSALSISTSTILQTIAVAPGHSASQVNGAFYTIGPAAAAAGLWVQDNNDGDAVVLGIVTAAGQSIFIDATDYSQYAGPVTVAGTTYTSVLTGYTNFPATFAANDSSTSGIGSFDATLGSESSLVGALTFTSTGGNSYPATWTLTYSTISLSGSLVSALAGSYTDSSTIEDPNTGGTVTISAAGVLGTSGTTTSGCVLDGTISTSDPTTNIYEVSYTYSGCAGAWADLNAVSFSGLAVLNASAGQIVMAANGQGGGGATYGLVTALTLQ